MEAPANTSNASAPKPRAGNWKRPTTPWWPSRPLRVRHRRNVAAQLYSPYRIPPDPVPQSFA
ncbi:transcriptional regulator DarR domain protein [Mycobacterium kansasii 662]|uniref:Transcriptional regulator DarR domain protein n=1 Tax=Mycobacterium kansasii 662 TaxID=1299326 RepID=X7XXR8_MYCKA|nr:transcriptional regulator DarR domain protein [Mycobacterium kansasii 662]